MTRKTGFLSSSCPQLTGIPTVHQEGRWFYSRISSSCYGTWCYSSFCWFEFTCRAGTFPEEVTTALGMWSWVWVVGHQKSHFELLVLNSLEFWGLLHMKGAWWFCWLCWFYWKCVWNVRPRVRECQTITDCFKDLFLKEKSVRSMLSYRLAQGGLFILFIMSGMGSVCVHMCVCMYARVLTQKAEENTRCLTLETVSLTEPHSSRVRFLHGC